MRALVNFAILAAAGALVVGPMTACRSGNSAIVAHTPFGSPFHAGVPDMVHMPPCYLVDRLESGQVLDANGRRIGTPQIGSVTPTILCTYSAGASNTTIEAAAKTASGRATQCADGAGR